MKRWMNGKGLGLNEEGDTEFVKIKKKRDKSGECHVICMCSLSISNNF